ncbi:MAG: RNA polymerase sigma factor RpoH [Rickettsiales bacterium]
MFSDMNFSGKSQSRAIAIPAAPSSADGLRRYLQDIAKFPILGQKEEYELSRRWREEEDVSAAHRLVTSHLRLVVKIAFRYRGYGLPMGELIAEGNIGMMQAVKRFEPEKGFRLSTYSIWWIKAAIQEYILRSWSMVKVGSSAAQKRLFFNLRKIKNKIGATGDRGMSEQQIEDVANILDVSKKEVVDMDSRMSGNDVYLNSTAYTDGEEEKIDLLVEPAESHEVALVKREEKEIRSKLLGEAMEKLSEREQDIIKRRRLQENPNTLEDLSQIYHISRERVRQIEAKAIEKLQKEMLGNPA